MDPVNPDIYKNIIQKITIGREFTKGWHENIIRWRKLYDGDHYTKKPKTGETQFNDPTYCNTVDLTVGILQGNDMRWKAAGWEPSKEEEKDTSDVEKYLAGVVNINNDRNEYDLRYEVDMHFTRDGGAVLYTVWDPDLQDMVQDKIEEQDEEGNLVIVDGLKEPPLVAKVIDPLEILLVPGGPKRWAAIIQEVYMSVYDIEVMTMTSLPDYKGRTIDDKMSTKVRYIDYWDLVYQDTPIDSAESVPVEPSDVVEAGDEDEPLIEKRLVVRHATLAEERFIEPLKIMEGYKDLPFTIGFYKPTQRTKSISWASCLAPLESTVDLLEKAINRRQRQIDIYSSLPIVVKGNQQRTINIDPGMGKLVRLGADEDFGFPVWPGNAPDVAQQIDFLRARVQQAGFSDVMFGSGASQITGYALSQMGDQNRIRLQQPIVHLEKFWSWWAKKVIDLTNEFAEGLKIAVYGKVKDKEFSEYLDAGDLIGYQVSCQIEPDFPNEEVRRHAMATQAKGTLSERTLMERYYKISQPDDERTQKLLEMMESDPAAVQYAIRVELTARAKVGDKSAEALLTMMDQANLGNQGGRPKEPNNPEQPLGLQSPTGQHQDMQDPNAQMSDEMAGASPNMDGGI